MQTRRFAIVCAVIAGALGCTTEDVDVEDAKIVWPGPKALPELCEMAATGQGTSTVIADFENAATDSEATSRGELITFNAMDGFSGGWFFYDDGTGDIDFRAIDDEEEAHGGNQFLYVKYIDTQDYGGGIGMWFNNGCYDASVYDGISFWARGEAASGIEFGVGTKATTRVLDGGDCEVTDCSDFIFPFDPEEEWTHYEVRWEDMVEGVPEGFDPTGITGIRWTSPLLRSGAITLYLDDISFLGGEGD